MNTTPDRAPLSDVDVVVRRAEVSGESFGAVDVVFDPDTALVRRLNPTATAIWRCTAAPRSVAAIVAEVLGPDAADSLKRDAVVGFCSELRAWGLLETVDEEVCS